LLSKYRRRLGSLSEARRDHIDHEREGRRRSTIEQTHGAPCDARVDADARDADVDAPIRVQRRHGAAYEAKL
jgi:hypothetical protein